jgi:hypothetical protein
LDGNESVSDEQPEEPGTPAVPEQRPEGGERPAPAGFQLPADYYATPPVASDRKIPRWVPIGCGLGGCLVLILLFVGGALLSSKGTSGFTVWFLGQLETDIDKRATADVTPAQRKEVKDALAALQVEAKSGRVGFTDMPALLESYKAALDDQKIDAAEAKEIAQAARSAARSHSKRER